ncbi:MAG TPA: BatA domain-containing protein [Pirellulaceae bacterium]|nr:BatA domain-containing protein [Pirellulaceae bacterium]
MGILAPLYLAGLAALSLPLILHLVRRTPKGRKDFSSLMFLSPTPPRLTRRSRLDQILLLLLRLAALALLAFAFARPFLRQEATLTMNSLPSRRVAILLDTSASMRQTGVWQRAIQQVEQELNDLGPQDEVALYTFGDRLRTHVAFDRTTSQPASVGDALPKVELARQALKSLEPTWSATDLGAALVAVASELDAASDVQQSAAEPQLVVISDFPKGARIEALQSYEWPKNVRLIAREVRPKQPTNAYVHLLRSETEEESEELRIRVVNSPGSSGDQFFVHWQEEAGPKDSLAYASGSSDASETAVYVPPGQSRVIKLPRPADRLQADRLVLTGDDHDFDNVHFVVPPLKQHVQIVYAGSDAADDALGMQYYLRLATSGDPLRQVEFLPLAGDDAKPLRATPPPKLAVVTREVSAALAAELKSFAERGGMVVLAPPDQAAAVAIPQLVDDVELLPAPAESEAGGEDYLLLGEIDFTHPLFAPFAGPRYSDFTKIHFWMHRGLKLKEGAPSHVVAKYDSGAPAIVERALGDGRVLVLASGWNPDDSQLALSTKFVPLVGGILDRACGIAAPKIGVTVDDPVPLDAGRRFATVITRPDGKDVEVAASSASFTDADQPGVYRAAAGSEVSRFAVNLAASESNTAPLEMDQLKQLGVRLSESMTRAERLSQMRQERDTELESRQKLWRWIVLGTLGLLIFETFWAGRTARQIAQAESTALG